MATSSMYDQWDDPGMAFTEEQVVGYNPQVWASGRIDELVHQVQVIYRARHVGIGKPAFWDKAARLLLDRATWYAQALTIPGVDREAVKVLPSIESDESKALTIEAQTLSGCDFMEWINEFEGNANRNMIYVVSIGRRCSVNTKLSSWRKRERSFSNKLANAVLHEVTLAEKLKEVLNSKTPKIQTP